MKKTLSALLLLGMALSGCGPVQPPAQKTTTPTATALPTRISTLIPGTSPTAPAYPAPTRPLLPAASATPLAGAIFIPTAGAQAQPYHDCTRTPGLVGCDAQAEPIAARLGFYDPQAARVLVLDLTTGEGWQAAGEVSQVDWLAGGSQLLVQPEQGSFQLFSPTGQELTFSADSPIGEDPPLFGADGRAAWLERSGGETALMVRPAGAKEAQPVFLHPQSPDTIYAADRLYILRGWVPGTEQILAQAYTAGGDAMIYGGELVTLDARTGEERRLNVNAPIGSTAEFAWNPRQEGALAFLASGEAAAGGPPRLTFLNLASQRMTYPKEEGLRVDGLAWQPDGARLTFAAQLEQAGAANRYAAPGIYALDPQSGAVELLTQPPKNAEDGRPGWSADGEVLLYGRWIESAPGSGVLQVRARRVADGRDWLVVEAPAPEVTRIQGRIAWQRYLAITPLEPEVP